MRASARERITSQSADELFHAAATRSFVAALEEVLSGWLAAGPEALAAESEAAACAPASQRACAQPLAPLTL